ncbi:MAG: helix-turn-helix transcriptional regulator [Lachnospiraceae bacterium]|nr:helix-turn-helix transcriptional regulator [Lachnospiraceae bacterium]
MLISERIFKKLEEMSMTQKEFSEKTGIRQSTISEWKKKHTNPSADKIMVICKVLGVEPEWLLSGSTVKGDYRNPVDWYVVDKDSDIGYMIESYNQMGAGQRERLLGYIEALREK